MYTIYDRVFGEFPANNTVHTLYIHLSYTVYNNIHHMQIPVYGSGQPYIAHSISRVDQNRIYTPYMTVYLVIFLPKVLYIHRIYIYGSGQP